MTKWSNNCSNARHESEAISGVISAIETDQPFKFYGNVMNKNSGLIVNLPQDCCVEVPCMADSFGIHPQGALELPTICQGLCMANIMAQKAAVEAALTSDRNKIVHSLLLDPLTASILTPEKIQIMVDDFLTAQSKWLDWVE